MEKTNRSYTNIDEYIDGFPQDTQKVLQEIRDIITKAAPEAEEKISYNMPAFFQNGILVYFAAYKNHVGFYPTANGIENFKAEFTSYTHSKGAVQFPLKEALPRDLITRIVKFRLDHNLNKK
jgi:uncharacterized protein YdhG (YjbR/CyaY superfamily)